MKCNHNFEKPTYEFLKKELGFFHCFKRTCKQCGHVHQQDVRCKSDAPLWAKEAEEVFHYHQF